jgi:pleiotropic regulator 1
MAADMSSVFAELRGLLLRNKLQTKSMYLANYGRPAAIDEKSAMTAVRLKIMDEYSSVQSMAAPAKQSLAPSLPPTETTDSSLPTPAPSSAASVVIRDVTGKRLSAAASTSSSTIEKLVDSIRTDTDEPSSKRVKLNTGSASSTALIEYKDPVSGGAGGGQLAVINPDRLDARTALILKNRERNLVKPVWHAPWKLKTVLPGHTGWVRCVAVDPANEWFVTGSADRTIKIWDLASGTLKITLTGHINTVRGVAVSDRHPYLFSCGEDKTVKCWDLEQNKVIRNYHGHLSGVYSLALHPTLDVLVTGGRDSTARVWDMRTKQQVRALTGHTNTIGSICCQSVDPQIITGSHDSTIRLWDLATGGCTSQLTNHKKSVRAVAVHPKEYTFASGSPDNIKVWKCPEGQFLRNVSGHNAIVNSLAVNRENVLVSAGDNGSLMFWDWRSGYNFQSLETKPQPGSLDAEAGIFEVTFDRTGSRLITAEADKSIKIWKEDETATPETHPLDWKPLKKRKKY